MRMSANETRSSFADAVVKYPSAANSNAGAPEAACAIGRPHDGCAMIAVAIPTMNADCAARTDASRPIWTGCACSGVGFGDLKPK